MTISSSLMMVMVKVKVKAMAMVKQAMVRVAVAYPIVWMTTQAGVTLTKRRTMAEERLKDAVREAHRKSIKAVVAGVVSRLNAVEDPRYGHLA